MKSKLSLFIFSLMISACGKISSSLDAVEEMKNSTAQMNAKMDLTNNGMSATNASVAKTNASTELMSAKMDVTNAGMAKTNAGMDKTNASMDKTNKAIHNQTLGVALDEILKPENTQYVSLDSVTPTSMMVPGKIFAEEATQEEIAQLVVTYILEINAAQPDSSLIDPKTLDYPDAVKNKIDTDKWIKFTVLQIITGLAPQATIEDMVKQQITSGGPFEHAALAALFLRHSFIATYLLDNSLLTEKMDNPGMFEKALEYIRYLKYIEKLPYTQSMAIPLAGFFDLGKHGLNKTWSLGAADVKTDYYPKLKANLNQLSSSFVNSKDLATNTRLSAIKKEINDGLAGK